jgi:hypothetical protein
MRLIVLGVLIACNQESPARLSRFDAELAAPAELDFGRVQVGAVATADVAVVNQGLGSFKLRSAVAEGALAGDGFAFTVAEVAEEKILAGGTYLWRVTFRADKPEAAAARVTLTYGDASGSAEHPLLLRGQGVQDGLVARPRAMNFGTVLVGGTADQVLALQNDTDAPMEVVIARECDAPCPFEVDAIPTLQAGQAAAAVVRYAPGGGVAHHSARLMVRACDNCLVAIDLAGESTNAALDCRQTFINFRLVNPGRKRTEQLQCINTSATPIRIHTWRIEGTNFSAPFDAARDVAPGESADIAVSFAPTLALYEGEGQANGSLTIEAQGPGGNLLVPWQVRLAGQAGGPTADLSARTLDFGRIALGTAHRKRLVIRNSGYHGLQVTALDASPPVFTADKSYLDLGPGKFAVVDVRFGPEATGLAKGVLLLRTNDGLQPQLEVTLQGTGVDMPLCNAELRDSPLDFGVVPVGTSAEQAFSLVNEGTTDCLVGDPQVLDPQVDAFTTEGALEQTLAAGARLALPVTFAPGAGARYFQEFRVYVSTPSASNPQGVMVGEGERRFEVGCPGPQSIDASGTLELTGTGDAPHPGLDAVRWDLAGAPPGGDATPGLWLPAARDVAKVTFRPYIVGSYQLRFSGQVDGQEKSCTTQVLVRGRGLRVALSWATEGDLDLHVHNDRESGWRTADDVYFQNKSPLWNPADLPGRAGNPLLEFDSTGGAEGPESVRLDLATIGGTYTVAVHNFNSAHLPEATLQIFCGSTQAAQSVVVSRPLRKYDFWVAAQVYFADADTCLVAAVDTVTNLGLGL